VGDKLLERNRLFGGLGLRRGFTVVELIVVIVVISILASVAVASYVYMKDDAMDTKVRSAVKAVGEALALVENQKMSLPVQGDWSVAGGTDVLVPKYLPTGYRDNITSKKVAPGSVVRWYKCSNGTIIVYGSLTNPTADDTTVFNKLKNSCSHAESYAPSDVYNYAKAF